MSTAQVRDFLVGEIPDTIAKDWKRIRKRSLAIHTHKYDGRLMENRDTGVSHWVITSSSKLPDGSLMVRHELFEPFSTWYFAIARVIEDPENGPLRLFFNPKEMWDRGEFFDFHCELYIRLLYGFPDWLEIDEECENSILVIGTKGNQTAGDLRDFFIHAGLEYSQSFQDDAIGDPEVNETLSDSDWDTPIAAMMV